MSYETLFCTAILRSPALTSYETLLGVVCCVLRKLFFGTGMFALSGAYVLQDSSRRSLLCLTKTLFLHCLCIAPSRLLMLRPTETLFLHCYVALSGAQTSYENSFSASTFPRITKALFRRSLLLRLLAMHRANHNLMESNLSYWMPLTRGERHSSFHPFNTS